jgi:hypothetical protein
MAKQSNIKQLHENMNDILVDLHNIQVSDERSREAKQDAILSLISIRKTLEHMGLHHCLQERGLA